VPEAPGQEVWAAPAVPYLQCHTYSLMRTCFNLFNILVCWFAFPAHIVLLCCLSPSTCM
jgi:hypothetical protein